MSENLKRRWFPIHLSMAILLMLEAGCLVPLSERVFNWADCSVDFPSNFGVTTLFAVFMTVFVPTILFTTFVHFEYLIRRREARKP